MQEPTPQQKAKIQANVATMRAKGATDDEVLQYLQYEEGQLASAPASGTDVNLKNLGRSALNQALFQFGDELGIVDREKNKAFQKEHPWASTGARIVGGALAPIALATLPATAPAAAALGGATAIAGGTGLLSGAGEGETMGERVKGAALEGLLGAGFGAAGYGAGKLLGKGASAIMDRIRPERAVARAANEIVDPATRSSLAGATPGTASMATAAVPQTGLQESRFLPMIRAVGASPKAAAQAEKDVLGQITSTTAEKASIGAAMDALDAPIPITTDLYLALQRAKEVLPSGKVPRGKMTSIQEVKDVLSRLRGMSKEGVDAHQLAVAKQAVADELYKLSPNFKTLDVQYGVAAEAERRARDILEAIQRSRANYAGNRAMKMTESSLGGSLHGRTRVIANLFDKVLTNKAGAADAVAKYITKPGGPQLIDDLLKNLPAGHAGMSAIRQGMAATAVPAAAGMLSAPDADY